MEFTHNQRKAHDLNRHMSVAAGAGSGKTAVLVNRYLKILLEQDIRVNQVVAITFTERAAAELKQRISHEIDAQIRTGRHSIARLEAIRDGLLSAQISTIHAFCARILREFPVEGGVDAGFSVLQGIEQRLALREAIETTLRHIASLPSEDAERAQLAYLLRLFGKRWLTKACEQLFAQRDTLHRLMETVYSLTDSGVAQRWREFIQTELSHSLETRYPVDRWVSCLDAVLSVAKGKNAPEVAALLETLQPTNARSTLAQIAPLLITKDGQIATRDFLGRGVKTEPLLEEIEFLAEAAKYIQQFPDLTADDLFLVDVTRQLLNLYAQIETAYERHKLLQGVLDFDDLQFKVREVLGQAYVREQLARRYAYIMVDEYQDTNRLQYDILKPLISAFKSGNLFIVGDQKQSIYGFRGADVRVFSQTQQEITAYQSTLDTDFVWEGDVLASTESERRGDVRLPENFRLLRNLVGTVNLVFAHVMQAADTSEFDVAYEPLIKGRANDHPGDVELLLTTKERRDSETPPPVPENDLIAARIADLIATEAVVWENEVARPMCYGDIAILIRSRTRLPEIEAALRRSQIPYQITGGIGFYQRQEIYDFHNYLQFLVNPDDDTALVGLLRAPFFGVSDAELFEIANSAKSKTLWEKVQAYTEAHTQKVDAEALRQSPLSMTVEVLTQHLDICHRLPVSMLIRKIANDTGIIGALSVEPQNWANYEKLLDVARNFEQTGFVDLATFVERVELLIAEEEHEDQASTTLTDDAVQILTVHAAKGLEFPVVILPHLNRQFRYDTEPFIDSELGIGFSPPDPQQAYQETHPAVTEVMRNRAKAKVVAEEKRLFYVAATRARDRLVFSGTLGARDDKGWLAWLLESLGIDDLPEEGWIQRETTVEALTPQGAQSHTFNLPIRVITSLDDLVPLPTSDTAREVPAQFPVFDISTLKPARGVGVFEVAELATYAHCPTRFYLRHRLHVDEAPENIDRPVFNADDSELSRAVRAVLGNVRTPAEAQHMNAAIQNAASEQATAEQIAFHTRQFLTSEIGQQALRSTSRCEKRIDIFIGDYQVTGQVGRVFQNAAGAWQGVDYKTDMAGRAEVATRIAYYRPQVELHALLLHRCFPDQDAVSMTLFFTHLAQAHTVSIAAEEFGEIQRTWQERIAQLESDLATGKFGKELERCPVCPYFVGGRCLL